MIYKYTQLLALTTSVISKEDMLVNETREFTYDNNLNSYLSLDMQYCRIFHMNKNHIVDEQIGILFDDDITNLNYIGAHTLKLHYMTLVEVYSRESLDKVELTDISDPLTRGVYDTARSVFELQREAAERPRISTIDDNIKFNFNVQMTAGAVCEKLHPCDANPKWKTPPVALPIEWGGSFADVWNNWCWAVENQNRRFFLVNDGCFSHSPIDIIAPLGGKYLSSRFSKEVNNIFLSNHNVKYPFHTSFSSFNVETKDNELIMVRRFGGISEASTAGPTNVKNPKVKIGLLRFEYGLEANGDFKVKSWSDTYKTQGNYYTNKDVDELFRSFVSSNTYEKYKGLSTDDKWSYLIYITERQYAKRDIIDGIPNPVYISQLDRLFDYNEMYNNFNYNLLTRNCQSFVKAYIELATRGLSSKYIKDKNFEDFVRKFQADVKRYLNIPISEQLVEQVMDFVKSVYNVLNSFSIEYNFIL